MGTPQPGYIWVPGRSPASRRVTPIPRLVVSTHLRQPRLAPPIPHPTPPLLHPWLAHPPLPGRLPHGEPLPNVHSDFPAHGHCPDCQQGWEKVQQGSQDSGTEKVSLETGPLPSEFPHRHHHELQFLLQLHVRITRGSLKLIGAWAPP